jgi:hypothetical protein
LADLWSILDDVKTVFALVGAGGLYGTYKFFASRPYRDPLYLFAGTNDLRDRLVRLKNRTVNFDSVLDFSIGGELSHIIAEQTEYRELLVSDPQSLNGRRLPLYIVTDHYTLDSFASLVVRMKESHRLKFSHGGTGVLQILLKGRFEIEVRAYSGPSVEITLREV